MVKIYIESKDEKLYEITINDFLKNTSKFANGQITKAGASKVLSETFLEIYDAMKDGDMNKIWTVVLESEPATGKIDYKTDYASVDLLQQFIIYYAEQLNDLLCQKVLNPKYVRASGNPALTDLNLYGVKRGNDAVIIKSFIFGTLKDEVELYIPTTCGSGGTSLLFNKLKDLIAEKAFYESVNNKIKYIHLDSIEKASTINFYSKLGFYKTNKETSTILKNMIKKIYINDFNYEDYIRQAGLNIGGSLYWSDDKKVLKKLKCAYEYHPELWFKNIKKMKADKISKSAVLNHFYSKYEELKGAGIPNESDDGYELQVVVVKKPIELDEAMEIAKKYIKKDKPFYRETSTSFRFRNIPKQRFSKNSFKSKKITPNITLVYGFLI
jgi:hypothetical protein